MPTIRDARTRQRGRISAHVEHNRWIVDLLEPRWVLDVRQRYHARAHLRGPRQGVMGLLQRFTQRDRLRRGCVETHGFQFGQTGAKDVFDIVEVLDQSPAPGRAQRWRQRKRNPAQRCEIVCSLC